MKQTLSAFSMLLMSSCSPMPAIIAEYRQIEESCAVVIESDLYQKYDIDPKKEMIVRYILFLAKEKRVYLSGCGPELVPLPKEYPTLDKEGYYPDNNNPVYRIIYYRFQKKELLDARYEVKCIVGGLSHTGSFMEWGGKHLMVEQQHGTYTCQTSTEPGSLPKLSEKQSGD